MSNSLHLKVKKFNDAQKARVMQGKNIASFRAGDNIIVEYQQIGLARPTTFIGTCITDKPNFFTVAKMSGAVQVVRSFSYYALSLISVQVKVKAKRYRRANLTYLIRDSNKV